MKDVVFEMPPIMLKFLLFAAIAIIGAIATIIWFFITYQFKKFNQVLDTVKETVGDLKTVVAVLTNKVDGDDQYSKEKHETINRRLDEGDKRMDNLSERIVRIETKLEIENEKS